MRSDARSLRLTPYPSLLTACTYGDRSLVSTARPHPCRICRFYATGNSSVYACLSTTGFAARLRA